MLLDLAAPQQPLHIRNANLERFTIDRLITIMARLDQHVDVSVTITPGVPKKARPSPPGQRDLGKRCDEKMSVDRRIGYNIPCTNR